MSLKKKLPNGVKLSLPKAKNTESHKRREKCIPTSQVGGTYTADERLRRKMKNSLR